MAIKQSTGARIGLSGNPSDGFGGKAIASVIGNFQATATLSEGSRLCIGHQDAPTLTTFRDRDDLANKLQRGELPAADKLVAATCKKFWEYCASHLVQLPDNNFELRYESSIPLQVGLGGSSAIITAVFKALMEFYRLTEADIPKPIQPNIVLSVETEELGIWAGLQDRVVEVYGGTVYMDFNDEFMKSHNHGIYENLDISLLPPLFLAYCAKPTNSAKAHGQMHARYKQGDQLVIATMKEIAELALSARQALKAGQTDLLGELMNKNFDLRRRLYGDDHLGAINLEMISIARELGLPAKLPGSGGAIVGICSDERLPEVQKKFQQHGYACCRVHPTAGDP